MLTYVRGGRHTSPPGGDQRNHLTVMLVRVKDGKLLKDLRNKPIRQALYEVKKYERVHVPF